MNRRKIIGYIGVVGVIIGILGILYSIEIVTYTYQDEHIFYRIKETGWIMGEYRNESMSYVQYFSISGIEEAIEHDAEMVGKFPDYPHITAYQEGHWIWHRWVTRRLLTYFFDSEFHQKFEEITSGQWIDVDYEELQLSTLGG